MHDMTRCNPAGYISNMMAAQDSCAHVRQLIGGHAEYIQPSPETNAYEYARGRDDYRYSEYYKGRCPKT